MKILTLTLNPAYDIHCYAENFEPFHENLAKVTDYEAGGKGVNISRALTVCGVKNTALVLLGKENGSDFVARLSADGIRYRAIEVPGRIRENITLHTNGKPETRISFEGFRADTALLGEVEKAILDTVGKGDVVTVTGRNPAGMEIADVKAMLARLTERGIRIVIDSRSFSLDDLLEVKPFLIKPNEEEISAYLGRTVSTFEEVRAAATGLHEAGITNVMISLGAKGAMLVCDKGCFTAMAPKVDAVSTIGAGDSSIAGFLAATAAGMEPDRALRMAVSYGSAACMTSGTRPPEKADVERFFAALDA